MFKNIKLTKVEALVPPSHPKTYVIDIPSVDSVVVDLWGSTLFVVDFFLVISFVDSNVDLLFVGPGPERALTL